MSYIEQREEWLQQHPKATPMEIWNAGYFQAVSNWCRKEKFG